MSEQKVAFQGEPGANSEAAARGYFGDDVTTLPRDTFQGIFEAVRTNEASHGMLPVENSLTGTVGQSYELLMEYDFRVQGEFILPIQYYLMAPDSTKLDDVKRVKSHPQALMQCANYLKRRGWEPVATVDTAGAARELKDRPEPNTAALAPILAAKLYGLNVLESNVEDESYNSTRFFVIGRGDAEVDRKARCKTSLVFTFQDHAGALYRCLGAFASHNINLTKLESRPVRGRAWQYWFFLDFEGHWQEPRVETALVELLRQASFVKMLGSYQTANGENR